MKVSLIDVDGRHFPNLALMKISAWHKKQGDTVDWYEPMFSKPSRIYASKVFTFSPDYTDYNPHDPEPIRGGTGYDATIKLPDEIENMLPDYTIYPQFSEAYGFLSRGCIRSCPWCVVPRKEGKIRVVSSLERVAQDRNEVVLMDNNFLAADRGFIKETLQYSRDHDIKLDFNQGLDARLIDDENARWLAGAKWLRYIRLACDTHAMLPVVNRAIKLLRSAGYKSSKDIMVYVLGIEPDETLQRIEELCAMDKRIIPHCQPYRDFSRGGQIINEELKRIALWCNRSWFRKASPYKEFIGKRKIANAQKYQESII